MQRGLATADGVVSPKSADHANWVNSSARGWRRSDGQTWNGLIPLGDTWWVRVLLPSMTIKPTFRTLVNFHGPVPRSCSSLPPLPLRATLSLFDSFTKTYLRFKLQSLPIPLLFFVCFWSGVGLTLRALYRDQSYFPENSPSALHEVV